MRSVRIRFLLAAAGGVVLVVLATTGTTGALWRDEASLDPGTVTTGSLELLAGGEPGTYVFDALSAANLAPGETSTAPLTLTNSGTTDLTYELGNVTVASAQTPADVELAGSLTLAVTTKASCGATVPESGVHTLYEGPLAGATFEGCELSPSSSIDLDITVRLSDAAPVSAAAGTVNATFIFRGDQVQ